VNFNNKSRTVVIFGASGFIGRYIVSDLVKDNWIIKVVVRNPDRAKYLTLIGRLGQVTIHQGNIIDIKNIEKIISHCSKVINLVGILEESNKQNFSNIHLSGAINIAKACYRNKIDGFIHFSALGLYDGNHSKYAKSKLEAENAVLSIFKKTIILKPSVVFGPEDNFTNKFARMASISLFMPLINSGKTKFQPVYVKDLSNAVSKIINKKSFDGQIYNLGGPEIMSFKEIIDLILIKIRKKRMYLYLSFPIAKLIALLFYFLPIKPITLDQVKLLEKDNTVPETGMGFKDLGINPASIKLKSEYYLKRYKSSY
jgi:uncharacterized protein YbjT (DUF2867 family)